jgi:hypothetical protein
MKKVFFALAIFSVFMTSCGTGSSESTTTTDSTGVTVDTTKCCDTTCVDTTCVDTLK